MDSSEGISNLFNKILLTSTFGMNQDRRPKITKPGFHSFLGDFGKAVVEANLSEKDSEISSFRSLVFLGLCHAAWRLGGESDEVHAAIRTFLIMRGRGSASPASYTVRKYRCIALKIIKCIDEIFLSHVGYRAFELLIHGKKTSNWDNRY